MRIEDFDTFKIKYIYWVFDNWYTMDVEDKELGVGTVLFDGRTREYIMLETTGDVLKYSYLAPECYLVMKPFVNN